MSRELLLRLQEAVTEECNGGYQTLTPELISRAAAW